MDYKQQHLKKYFEERPAINVTDIEQAVEIPKDTIRHFLKERRNIPQKYFSEIENELVKYGYQPLLAE